MKSTQSRSFQTLLLFGVCLVIVLLMGIWIRTWLVRPIERTAKGSTTLPSLPVNATIAAPAAKPIALPSITTILPESARPTGPRVGGPPVSANFVHNPQKSMVNAVHFLNRGQQLARYGGKLYRDDKGNFTGNSYLDVCDLPDGSPTYMCENNGFPCFNAAFTSDGHRALFSSIDWANQGHSHLYLTDFADDFGGATVNELEFITG